MKLPTKGEFIAGLIISGFLVSCLVLGIFSKRMFELAVLMIVMNIFNQILEKLKKKLHAPHILKVHKFIVCNIVTFIILCISLIIIIITEEMLIYWQSILLGVFTLILSCFNLSKVFYGEKPNFGKKKKESKYINIQEIVMHTPLHPDLLDFESWLKSENGTEYLVFKYRFRDNLSFEKIRDELKLGDTARVTEILDKVTFAFKCHCKI